MRIAAALAATTALVLLTPAAQAAPTDKAAALAAGDWRAAAQLGASAADVVRALQARGALSDVAADEAVVTIGPDNHVDAEVLLPLPPLPADVAKADVRTAGLGGSGFTFTARPGAIVLYPTYAARSFAPSAPASH